MKKLLFSIVLLAISTFSFAQILDSSTVYFENFDGSTVNVTVETSYNFPWRSQDNHPTAACQNLAKSPPKCYYIGREVGANLRGDARMMTPAFPVNHDRKYVYLAFDHICKVANLNNDCMKISIEYSYDGIEFFDDRAYIYFANSATSPAYAYDVANNYNWISAYSTQIYRHDGTAAGATDRGYSQSSYSTWGTNDATSPTNSWWKSEFLELRNAVYNSVGTYNYYRIVFYCRQGSGAGVYNPGWFVDNVRVIESNADIFAPTLTWTPPHYNYGYAANLANNIGPYTINAAIKDNRDTVNVSTIRLTYSVNGGSPVVVFPTYSQTLTAALHTVNISAEIPEMCYGDTIWYRIDFEDTHGNSNFAEREFSPYSTLPNVTSNDAGLIDFYGFPWNFITGQRDTIRAIIHNRSPNIQEQVLIGLKANNDDHPDYEWEGEMCMDYTDSIADLGTFIPIRGWNEITAYIKLRNNAADNGIVLNDTIRYRGYACDSAMNGTYTMGSPTSDFPTLRDLKHNLWYCQVAGPVIIKMAPGTYNNLVFDTTYRGMSEINYVQFQSGTGNPADVIIADTAPSTVLTSAALTFTKVNYFRFHNVTINGKVGGNSSRGVFFTGGGSSHIHISDCKINIANNYTSTSNNYMGIGRITAAPSANQAPMDTIHIRNNTITGGVYGINHTGATTSKGVLYIEGNTITTSYRGISVFYARVPVIDGNRIYSLTQGETSYVGIYLDRGEQLGSISKNIISSKNTQYGILLTTCAANTTPTLISNNAVDVEFNASGSAGIELHASSNVSLINNTVRTTSTNILEQTAAMQIRTGTITNITFTNNIFANACRSTTNKNYAVYFNVMPVIFTANNNNYYSEGYNIGYYSVPRATIEDWRYATNGQEANSISLRPNFSTSSTDILSLDSYDGFECSRDANVLTDITGMQRATLTHMGAYTTVVPSVNLAVTRLASPVDILCPEATYSFEVALMNAGSEPIVFSPTNRAKIVVTFSGAINIVDTIYHATGTINPLQEAIVVLGNYPLPVNSIVDLEVIVKMPGDTLPSNDILRTSFKIDLISMNNARGENEFEETFSDNLTDPLWKIRQINGAGNWIVEQGAGLNPAISPIYGTGRLHFNAKAFAANPQPISRIYLPTISLDSSVNPIMEVWYAHDNVGSGNARTKEGVVIRVGTGENEPSIALRPREVPGDTLLVRYKNTAPTAGMWVKYTYDLSNWIDESCVRISIDAIGYGGNNINIDRILIRNVLDNDCMVNDFYYYSEAPTQQELSTKVKARISNIGAQNQTAVAATLTISGANTYAETISNIALASQQETLIYFNGTDLTNIGDNTITVSVNADQNFTNNSVSKMLTSYADRVSYSDTNSNKIQIGSNTAGYKLANRVNVDEEIIVQAVRFMPISAIDAVGKRVLGFASDRTGNIRVYTDTLTITSEMVDNWVEMPLINYALSNVSDYFYVGIELVDPGFYIAAQLESPLRDSVFYILNTNGTYSPQLLGKSMIGAKIDKSVTQELAILELVSPRTNCDLGHENISIRITNNGSQTIPEGAVFHCTINGVNHYVDTLRETLGRLETKIFTFSDHPNMTNNEVGYDSSFNFIIWVETIAGDRINFNDTLTKEIISLGKANLPTVVSPMNVSYHTTANLTAQYPSTIPSTAGEFSWFANLGFESWQLLHQGDVFTTPTIYFDTTFYVNVAPGSLAETTVGTVATSSNMQPFMFANNYAKGRILYERSELGSDAGPISKIALYVHAAAAANVEGIPIKLYIKNTTIPIFTTNTNFTWADEIADALLIYDGNLVVTETGWYEFQFPEVFEYTGDNVLILTETNCGGSCGASPTFKTTSKSNTVQYFTSSNPITTGRYSNSPNRFTMRFHFSNLNCASEKVPIQLHVPNIPTYDVETVEFLYPYTNPNPLFENCALEWENVKVSILNRLNTSIPANTVVVNATFNGSSISHVVSEEFAPHELKEVTFATPFDFKAPTANITWNYVVATDLLDGVNIYRANDTIRGSFISYQTDYFPDVIDTMGEYSHPFTINISPTHNYCFFYTSENATTPITGGNNVSQFTTPVLYDSVTYWVEARNISSANPRCTTKRIQYNINIIVPDHDLAMLSLNDPINYECGLMDVNLDVTVKSTKDSIIPAGTFKAKANFTGTATRSVEHTINTPINGQATVTFPFGNTVTLGSTTINNIYNYKIFVDPIDPTMTIYHGNDTISGTLKVPATPLAPSVMNLTGTYGDPKLVSPSTTTLNYFYFYDQQTGGELLGEGPTFTTPELYAPQTYYYSGRITQPEFAIPLQLGTNSTSTEDPFKFTSTTGISQGIVLYTSDELGGYAGWIDTIALNILTPSLGEVPVKLYLKNDTKTSLTTTENFNNLKAGATLIYDSSTDFANSDGWFRILIPSGFYYTGQSLLLLTEHDCDGGSCINYGVYPTPKFKASSKPGRVVSRGSTTQNFGTVGNRINTKFYINYTCKSPRSQITVTPAPVPTCDLMITRIESPVTPKETPYTATETVKIHFKNYGTAAASGFSVGYTYNGNTVTETYSGASIPSGGTGTHTFAARLDLTEVYFPTEFKAFVAQTCDNFSRNDEMTIYLQRPNPCISRATEVTGADISNVTFAGISTGLGTPIFNYTPAPGHDSRYTDYTLDPNVPIREVVQGQFYPFSMTNSFSANSGSSLYKHVYIDLNRDNEFTANERLFYASVAAPTQTNQGLATTTGVITIPENATPGITRMRVIAATGTNANSNADVQPCIPYQYGETEDYAIEILDPYTNDLAIYQIFHPDGEICADANGRIRIIVKNFGLVPQYFTTELPLQFTATVTGAVPATYTKTITNGSLAAGDLMTVIIDNVDFSAVGDYTVNITMTYPNDMYLVNNQATSHANVPNLNLWDFEKEEFNDATFATEWTTETNNSNYKWNVFQEKTGNSPKAGPLHDHTVGDPMIGYPEGRFAAVSAASSVNASAMATLTSACMNLHYEFGYPQRLIYWYHIFGENAAARTNFYVYVGSGDNYLLVDSLFNRTQTSTDANWLKRSIDLLNIDEVARIRFVSTGHNLLIDPAIDDISVVNGFPDIGIEEIVFPIHYSEEICVGHSDSVNMVVRVKNYGSVPVTDFEIKGRLEIGAESQEIVETISGNLQPGESREYTFIGRLVTSRIYDHNQVSAETILDHDANPDNNISTTIICLGDGIDDHESGNGVILGQNIPNPANMNTVIPFFIPQGGNVKFTIHAIEGQLLYTHESAYDMGEHQLELSTSKFANGLYFYTLYYNDVVISKKMVIQRQ